MSSKRGPRPSDKGTSSKRRKASTSTITSNSSLPQASCEDQLVHRIAVAVTQALKDQHNVHTPTSPTMHGQSVPAPQHQPDSLPLVQQSVSEAIQQITGPRRCAHSDRIALWMSNFSRWRPSGKN